MKRTERSLSELYADDPERADALASGRKTPASRRGFLGGAGLAAMGAAAGGAIPFASGMPVGLVPAALAQSGGAPSGPRRLDHQAFPPKAPPKAPAVAGGWKSLFAPQ